MESVTVKRKKVSYHYSFPYFNRACMDLLFPSCFQVWSSFSRKLELRCTEEYTNKFIYTGHKNQYGHYVIDIAKLSWKLKNSVNLEFWSITYILETLGVPHPEGLLAKNSHVFTSCFKKILRIFISKLWRVSMFWCWRR